MKGKLGESESETILNIVVDHLSEQGYLAKKETITMSKTSKKNPIREIAEKLDAFDEMFTTFLELVKNKGLIEQSEFEAKLRARIEKRSTKRSYRDIQLARSGT